MSAEQFLDLLDDRGVLMPADVASLREQVAESPESMHPVFIARRLVTAGFLNPYFAKTLLADGAEMYASAADDGDLLVPLNDDDGAEARLAAHAAAELQAEMNAVLDDLHLAPIGDVDLLSHDETAEVALLPSAQAKTGIAALFAPKSTWQLGSKKQPAFERRLLIACAVLGVLVIGLLVFIAVGG